MLLKFYNVIFYNYFKGLSYNLESWFWKGEWWVLVIFWIDMKCNKINKESWEEEKVSCYLILEF